jgi:ubiquinone/menaquinone biosynthesis C-methylase UbiE
MRDWDNIYKNRGEVQTRVLSKIRRIVPLLKENQTERVLDLGCGTGRHTFFLARQGFRVTGIDISKTALSIIRNKLNKTQIKNIQLMRHDMQLIPFSNGYFDAVICTGVLTHGTINKIISTVKEIHRVIRGNGILITDALSIKDPDYRTGKGHTTRKIGYKKRKNYVASWDILAIK